jgi:hypothetical protein
VIVLALLLAAAPASGTVRGTLTFSGDAPAPAKIDPQTDREICSAQELVDESLLVDGKTRGVKNVAVWIEKTKAPPATTYTLDNSGCRFEPHVLIVPAKTEVTIRNKDTSRCLRAIRNRRKNLQCRARTRSAATFTLG